ncbi:MAG: ABC transporter permease [Bacteroidetes Order II. Incertae sedis bacterium]|nr:ABC transporter permease [Bacteroidetes Order II. bacterium]MBT6424109.1 ABC transporter permease [Bacteroidetes Order II. bacterium]MBT6582503.1 ABC transporter permease [Bacteroidetes Order II. bacterium]MBT6599399.1 ABC transporter permease [Bacteroidetes Order II. bacterium]MBT7400018.1 ABC transporter permease [Bacteroidetes Order II. bacterium]
MNYRFMIARRYLTSPRSVSLISRITGISVVGVALGVAALIVVLSVLNGFFEFVRDMLVSYDPHIRIVSLEERGFESADSLIALSLTHNQVKSATAYVEGKAMLLHEGAGDVNKVVIVRGVDDGFSSGEDGVAASTTMGQFDVSRVDGRPGIVMGRRLGERLLLSPGGGSAEASRVALLSAPAIERMYTRVLQSSPFRQFEVRGLFQLEAVFDESHAFIDLGEAQRLFSMGRHVSGVELRLHDLDQAEAVKVWLQKELDASKFEAQTWYDLQKSLYDVMRLEKFGASLILLLIVIVAAFNIVGSLTMIVIEKRRDVGALRAMGVSKRNVRKIFLSEGLLIGVVGAGAGVGLGLLISWVQKAYQLVPLPDAGSFLISAYPVSIHWVDVFIIGAMALFLCVAAAYYPATRASAIEPAEALKMDG